jgi:hypothetical protein
MTITTEPTLIQRMRAIKELPSPAERRRIRDAAKLSRADIARELRAKGLHVTEGAIKFWETERAQGGFDPRPEKAIAYKQLLDYIERELNALSTGSN